MSPQDLSKIVLGTAQFGFEYGVNSIGRPSEKNVFEILDWANSNGITEVDTADGYGEASDILKKYFLKNGHAFSVMTKFSKTSNNCFLDIFSESLKRLGVDHLDGYYFHRFSDFLDFDRFEDVHLLKKTGQLKRIAVSLYSDLDLEQAVNHPEVDQIQLPFNLLDRGEIKVDLLQEAKRNGKVIYARSIFLQGLFFISPSNLPEKLRPFRDTLLELQDIAKFYELKIEDICLNYVYHKKFIDKLVIGVDSQKQLESNLKSLMISFPKDLEKKLENIQVPEQNLLNPSNWN